MSIKPSWNWGILILLALKCFLKFLLKAFLPFEVIAKYLKLREKHFPESNIVLEAREIFVKDKIWSHPIKAYWDFTFYQQFDIYAHISVCYDGMIMWWPKRRYIKVLQFKMKTFSFFLEAPPKNAFNIVFTTTGTTDKRLLDSW